MSGECAGADCGYIQAAVAAADELQPRAELERERRELFFAGTPFSTEGPSGQAVQAVKLEAAVAELSCSGEPCAFALAAINKYVQFEANNRSGQ